MSGLYLHIPFCKQACSYCDFYFVTRQHQQQDFVHALVQEIRSKRDTKFTQDKIRTIYFGGGTPSLLSTDQLEQIIAAIDDTFSLEVEECTMELNPDDVSQNYLAAIHSMGITRASMGVQSFDEDLLRFMHRAHSREEALRCLELLAKTGFESFTVDLIYGNPNQSIEMLSKDIEKLLEFNPPHISAYSLTIEENTRLGKQVSLGRLQAPEDDFTAQHFEIVHQKLSEKGIHQYEVSNFAKPGFEAKHNSAYWSHKNYLGLGPSAHSFWWNDDRQSAERWNNKKDINAYLKSDWEEKSDLEILELHQLAEERVMLGLRTKKGVNPADLTQRYNFNLSERQKAYLQAKERDGMVEYNPDRIALTSTGLVIADLIILDLITA